MDRSGLIGATAVLAAIALGVAAWAAILDVYADHCERKYDRINQALRDAPGYRENVDALFHSIGEKPPKP